LEEHEIVPLNTHSTQQENRRETALKNRAASTPKRLEPQRYICTPSFDASAFLSRPVLNRVDDLIRNVYILEGMLIQSPKRSRTNSLQLGE